MSTPAEFRNVSKRKRKILGIYFSMKPNGTLPNRRLARRESKPSRSTSLRPSAERFNKLSASAINIKLINRNMSMPQKSERRTASP